MTVSGGKGQNRLLPPKCDPFSRPDTDSFDAWYAGLRAAGPLLRAGTGAWALPRYGEIVRILRDPRVAVFRFAGPSQMADREEAGQAVAEASHAFLDSTIVAASPPSHARLRKLLAPLVVRRLTGALEAMVDEATREILAHRTESRNIEAVSDLAFPLTLKILSHLFALPHDRADAIGRDVLKLSKLFSPYIAAADLASANAAVRTLRVAFAELLDARRRGEARDICSDIRVAIDGGLLSRGEAVDNAVFLMFAGLETSVNMIAAGCAAFAAAPDQFAVLRADPGLAASAVEEFLRYDAPTQITARVVTEPIDIAGRAIGKGRMLLLMLGSANHDPAQFTHPSRLNITRNPNPHLAFGAGGHTCLGAGLARLLGKAVFRRVAQTVAAFEPAGEVLRDSCTTPRIYLRVPLRLTT